MPRKEHNSDFEYFTDYHENKKFPNQSTFDTTGNVQVSVVQKVNG